MQRAPWAAIWLMAATGGVLALPAAAVETAKVDVEFVPTDREPKVPEQFRLGTHTFPVASEPGPLASDKVAMSLVTFPSAVETPHANNNTVHCEYFCPRGGAGPYPAVVVLHILGGDFDLSRAFCRQFAHKNVAALFLKMPYYGPRRQPDAPARMVSADLQMSVAGMRQAILDIRRATAWLAAQDEVDAQRLGIFGISLGGITGALAATAEPRLHNVCLMLAGGDIGQVAWESPELAQVRPEWLKQAGSKERVFELLRQVDPVVHAEGVRGKRILMLNALHDEVIPRACTDSLWQAFGEPRIVWYEAGHYSVARFMFDGMAESTRFFMASEPMAGD